MCLDDYDIWCSLKVWASHSDKILSTLSSNLVNRNIFKVEISDTPFSLDYISEKRVSLKNALGLDDESTDYMLSTIKVSNDMYNIYDDSIDILDKNGDITDVCQLSDMLNIESLSKHVINYYLCYHRI